MRIVIPTIQHTGTKLVANMFKSTFKWAAINEFQDGAIHVGHISTSQMGNINAHLKEMPAVVPIRHPYLVYESWSRRGKTATELVNCWRLLVNEVDSYDPYYIAIDTPERVEHLEQINEGLGLQLQNKWEPVNVVSNTWQMKPEDIEPSQEIIDLVEEIKPFLDKFY